jgi:hypothetical protein
MLTDSETSANARALLLSALSGLDRLLEEALRLAPDVYGWEPGTMKFRGLYIAQADAGRLLRREVGSSPFGDVGAEPFFAVEEIPGLAVLAEQYGLAWFDCAIILIALAPELDLRYERLYAFLQDDVSRRRPSVDLILNLLCPTAGERMDFRSHFAPDGVLVRERLIHLAPEANQNNSPLLAMGLKLDEQIVAELLGFAHLDSRLGEFCKWGAENIDLASLPLEAETLDGLRRMAMDVRRGLGPLRVVLGGPVMPLHLRTTQALASELMRPLLVFDLSQAAPSKSIGDLLPVLVRQVHRRQAVLHIDCETLDERTAGILARELSLREADVVLTMPVLAPALEEAGFHVIEFPRPSFATRQEQWRANLAACGTELAEEEIDSLAARFRLYPDEIAAAVKAGRSRARWAGRPQAAASDLSASARALTGRQIGNLARKIEPKYGWDDIVLPPETTSQLRAICSRVALQHLVLEEWGFDHKLSMGKGVAALFAGPSGVGKTMAAEVIARALDIDLYKIDLSGVVSKYIGETEKNLDRVFTAAENANAILFFDEADALFGKRSEVKDSHDRYANIEISYLLQKMEMYNGVAILATNLRQNLDEAFLRRLAFTIHFPFPAMEDRRRIWRSIWPSAVPLDADADFDFLASTFKLSGGNIKNIALAAAFLAAEEGGSVGMGHLERAIDREFQKLGKPLDPNSFGPYARRAVL